MGAVTLISDSFLKRKIRELSLLKPNNARRSTLFFTFACRAIGECAREVEGSSFGPRMSEFCGQLDEGLAYGDPILKPPGLSLRETNEYVPVDQMATPC